MKRIITFLLTILILFSLGGCALVHPAYTDPELSPTPEQEAQALAESILADMSLADKVGQMLLVNCSVPGTAEKAASFGVGGLCLFANTFEDLTAADVRPLLTSYQDASRYPLLISTDEEGGGVCRVSLHPLLREAPFASPSELHELGSAAVMADTAEKAELLLSLGVNVNLAPVCDVPLHEWDYIFSRCYSTDAKETAEYISSVVGIMKDKGLGSTLKHFPGYGGSTDTHMGAAADTRSLDEFTSRDLLPFIAGIEAGADAVMVSHNTVLCMDENNPASLSPEVHRLLRQELGFDGVIMTDDLAMGAVTGSTDTADAVIRAVKAGNDILCLVDYELAHQTLLDAVNRGVIPVSRIDESVLRILLWKIELGLL